jgi:hypothetical protein
VGGAAAAPAPKVTAKPMPIYRLPNSPKEIDMSLKSREDAAHFIASTLYLRLDREATPEELSEATRDVLTVLCSNEDFERLKAYMSYVVYDSPNFPHVDEKGESWTWFETHLKANYPVKTFLKHLATISLLADALSVRRARERKERERTPLEGGLSQDKWDAMFDDLENSSE